MSARDFGWATRQRGEAWAEMRELGPVRFLSSFYFSFLFVLDFKFKLKYVLPNSYSDKINKFKYHYEKSLFIYICNLFCI